REFGLLVGLANRPAGKAPCDGDHVLLRVAAVDAKRVELEQLAAVVLVEAVRHTSKSRGLIEGSWRAGRERTEIEWLRTHRLPVVQVVEHRRMASSGEQQVLELAENTGADRVALVTRDHRAGALFAFEDVEEVEPEIGEHLLQLAIGVDGAEELGFAEIARD